MKNHFFYAFLIIFLATAIITLLGISEVIHIQEFYLKGLFGALLIELVGVVIGLYKKTDFFVDGNVNSQHPRPDNVTIPPIEASEHIGRDAYMKMIASEINSAKDEVLFTSRTMAHVSKDESQRLIIQACQRRARLGNMIHRGIVCANPDTIRGAISLKREANHVDVKFNTQQLELIDMSYFIVDQERVILGLGRETTKTFYSLESRALAHLLRNHFNRLWEDSAPMHVYVDKTFKDACLEVGKSSALQIVGFDSDSELEAWISPLRTIESKRLPDTEHRFDTPKWRLDGRIHNHLNFIAESAVNGGLLTNDLVILLKNTISLAHSIDYSVHAYSFLYLFFSANYYKTRFSLSRGVEQKKYMNPIRVLDLGCGSGASTLAIIDWYGSMHGPMPAILIDAVDISPMQIDLHRKVFERHVLGDNIGIDRHILDAIIYISHCKTKYDLIIDSHFLCELSAQQKLNIIDMLPSALQSDGVFLVIEQTQSGVHDELNSAEKFILRYHDVIGPLDMPISDRISTRGIETSSKGTYTVSYGSYIKN